ncbi:hypothetical protein [Amycolatopsis sp. NPDC004625]|uniref:hypothetical protein n=1 Tax=Amycolatopsis sp. NPDC004625 TaxID=3154670 RepID=UPI00339FA8A3
MHLARDHHLDLVTLWPHLWLILPEEARTQVTTARRNLTRATTLTAWAVLYLPLATWWWPAILITIALALTGWVRTRAATDTYALLLEATTRLHTHNLAEHLGLGPTSPLSHKTGDALTQHLAPSPPPPPSG